jgi:hypothetical protein
MQYSRAKAAVSSAGPLTVYCLFILLVFGGFAGAVYHQLTPSRMPNPGVAAYNPPPGTVLAAAPAREVPAVEPSADGTQGRPAPVTPEVKDEPAKPVAEAKDPPPPAAEEKPPKRKVAKRPKRERKTRPPNPRSDYAAQPRRDGFESWGWHRPPQRSPGFRLF